MYVVINKHMTDNRFFVVSDGHPVSKQKTVFVEISEKKYNVGTQLGCGQVF